MSEMETYSLNVNGDDREFQADPDMPLLWVLRDLLALTGTKYGCGIAQCGVCMVLVDGDPLPSCVTPIGSVVNKAVTTIEGLSVDRSHPLQRAWVDLQVPQCGYCQSGQLITAAALLMQNQNPTDTDIDKAMSPVLCRCGTYQRIRAAIHQAASLMNRSGTD